MKDEPSKFVILDEKRAGALARFTAWVSACIENVPTTRSPYSLTQRWKNSNTQQLLTLTKSKAISWAEESIFCAMIASSIAKTWNLWRQKLSTSVRFNFLIYDVRGNKELALKRLMADTFPVWIPFQRDLLSEYKFEICVNTTSTTTRHPRLMW